MPPSVIPAGWRSSTRCCSATRRRASCSGSWRCRRTCSPTTSRCWSTSGLVVRHRSEADRRRTYLRAGARTRSTRCRPVTVARRGAGGVRLHRTTRPAPSSPPPCGTTRSQRSRRPRPAPTRPPRMHPGAVAARPPPRRPPRPRRHRARRTTSSTRRRPASSPSATPPTRNSPARSRRVTRRTAALVGPGPGPHRQPTRRSTAVVTDLTDRIARVAPALAARTDPTGGPDERSDYRHPDLSIDQQLALQHRRDQPGPPSSTAPSAPRRSSGSCTAPTTSSPAAPSSRTTCRCWPSASPASGCTPWPRSRASTTTACRWCCSCAPTTPAARRWPSASSQHLAGDRGHRLVRRLRARRPAINPAAIEAMAERGIDISGEYPKPWTDEVVRAADVVVTMGCGDACPVFPGTPLRGLGPRRPRRPRPGPTCARSATRSSAASAGCCGELEGARPCLTSHQRHRPRSARRLLAEFLGTALLGRRGHRLRHRRARLSPTDIGLQLLQNSVDHGVRRSAC